MFELFENNRDLISIIIKFIWKEYPQAIHNPLRVARNIYRGGKNNSNIKNMNLNVLRNSIVKSVINTPNKDITDTSFNKDITSPNKDINSPNKQIHNVPPVNIYPTTINNNIDSLKCLMISF